MPGLVRETRSQHCTPPGQSDAKPSVVSFQDEVNLCNSAHYLWNSRFKIRFCQDVIILVFAEICLFSLFFPLLTEQYNVVGPTDPVLAVADEDVILPCTIKPDTSAEDMRVEWFRLDLQDSVVHLYEDHKDRNTDQSQSYRGRTQLFNQELQKGNASLKLSTVQVSDEGLYKCLIQSKSWYDDITLNVTVEAVGTPPLITIDGFDYSGGVHLQCESKGWNPEPELVWLDHEGVALKSEATDTQRDTDGFSVKHTITVYNSDSKYHCRVQMRHHMLETEINISFITLLRKHAVTVTLDPDSAHPRLIVSDNGKQVRDGHTELKKDEDEEQSDTFDECLGVLGKEGFSSGCFYFEVQLKGLTEWYLGVAKELINRKGMINLLPINGFWTVAHKNGFMYVALESDFASLFQTGWPQRVGVFVDYEEGLVSFFDVEDRSQIVSFTGLSFTEKLYPFFGLGYLCSKTTGQLIICNDF
ncbi:butyrophilin-like protein 3 [Myxocyprinus asiaticus]|uniref:butyrophilin-like protein 3 n=1 Tax=Myxocyprinus asiaticus TaxID=70543 RepID=UPI0022232005|nr:butyrophilin-like protein 3 [Myxocyprinus asiaticus]